MEVFELISIVFKKCPEKMFWKLQGNVTCRINDLSNLRSFTKWRLKYVGF